MHLPGLPPIVPFCLIHWGTVADLLVAAGTLVLAAVAVFQETIRGWFYRPKFKTSVKTEPPDCVAVPFTRLDGTFVANSVYLRLWVENDGNATARNAEVYAKELRRQRADGTWERVGTFPPMNLRWANLLGKIYFPSIAPDMGKHCDVGHIVDPACRHLLQEDAPGLALTNQQTSLAFDLMVAPNHRGHIIGPGDYQLDILVAAENVCPIKRTLEIHLRGIWDADETRMLRDGVGVTVR
ncbi:MAG: hypothetical protein ACLQJF_21095 [Candidatus Sulfotelmatobacter sp.]